MAEARNAALVRRAVEEIWNQGQLDVADVLFAADYINHAGLIPDFVRGPEAIKISVAFYRTAFPHLQITIDALTAQRDAVLLRWTARSASSATPVALAGLIVSRCAGGQIVESWMQWDQPGALALLQRTTLTEIAVEKNSTIIFPLPVDTIKVFLDRLAGVHHDNGVLPHDAPALVVPK